MRSGLVVVNDSQAAARAVAHAAGLAQREDGWLTLLWVVEPARSAGAGPYLVGIPERSVDAAEERLLSLADLVPAEVPVHTVLRRGLLLEEIVRRVKAAGHDTIVIGSDGRHLPFIGECLSCAVRKRSGIPVITVTASAREGSCCYKLRLPTPATILRARYFRTRRQTVRSERESS